MGCGVDVGDDVGDCVGDGIGSMRSVMSEPLWSSLLVDEATGGVVKSSGRAVGDGTASPVPQAISAKRVRMPTADLNSPSALPSHPLQRFTALSHQAIFRKCPGICKSTTMRLGRGHFERKFSPCVPEILREPPRPPPRPRGPVIPARGIMIQDKSSSRPFRTAQTTSCCFVSIPSLSWMP